LKTTIEMVWIAAHTRLDAADLLREEAKRLRKEASSKDNRFTVALWLKARDFEILADQLEKESE